MPPAYGHRVSINLPIDDVGLHASPFFSSARRARYVSCRCTRPATVLFNALPPLGCPQKAFLVILPDSQYSSHAAARADVHYRACRHCACSTALLPGDCRANAGFISCGYPYWKHAAATMLSAERSDGGRATIGRGGIGGFVPSLCACCIFRRLPGCDAEKNAAFYLCWNGRWAAPRAYRRAARQRGGRAAASQARCSAGSASPARCLTIPPPRRLPRVTPPGFCCPSASLAAALST